MQLGDECCEGSNNETRFLMWPQLVVTFTPAPGAMSTVRITTRPPKSVCEGQHSFGCLNSGMVVKTLAHAFKAHQELPQYCLFCLACQFKVNLYLVYESPVLKRISSLWGLKARGTVLFSSISLHCLLRKVFLSPLAILWNSAFKWLYLSFLPLPFSSLLFTAICKVSSDNHFAFLHFFFLGTKSTLPPTYETHLTWQNCVHGKTNVNYSL